MEQEAKISQGKQSQTTPGKVVKKQRLGVPEPSTAEQQVPGEEHEDVAKRLFQARQK